MGWSTTLHLRHRDVDYLGHVTAAAYLALFEEARAAWIGAVAEDGLATYVVARQVIDYRRELLFAEGPVRVTINVESVGERSVDVSEVLETDAGELRTTSSATLVMWDRDSREARAISTAERALFDAARGPDRPVATERRS